MMEKKKEYKFVIDHLALMKEWLENKNEAEGLDPKKLLIGSKKKVWWKCVQGHEYQATIHDRAKRGTGCPYCSGRYAIKGVNDLRSINNLLASEWDQDKNGALKPEDVLPGSHKHVWWKCNICNHSWNAEIKSRNNGNGCPICGRKKATLSKATPEVGKSFAELCPDIVKEWDYEKNIDLDPLLIKPSSVRMAYWKCANGHSWAAKVSYRALRNNGCPECYAAKKTSFPEQAIFFYISQVFKAINRDKSHGFEFDIFVEKENLAIEYDGLYWHSSEFAKNMESRKNQYCDNHKIKLYRVKESDDRNNPVCINGRTISYYYDISYTFLNQALELLFQYIEKDTGKEFSLTPDVEKDRATILSQFEQIKRDNSLLHYPVLVREWDYEANKGLLPENVSPGSEKRVHWICVKGHRYFSRVSHRVNGVGCPFCSGKRIVPGENDLGSKNPILAAQWNFEKNGQLLPVQVSPSSNRKVWWKCNKGHEWQATINSRNTGKGCPYCSGRRYSKIRCLENGRIYSTYAEIENDLDVNRTNVSQVLHGTRKSTKGYHFEFVVEE